MGIHGAIRLSGLLWVSFPFLVTCGAAAFFFTRLFDSSRLFNQGSILLAVDGSRWTGLVYNYWTTIHFHALLYRGTAMTGRLFQSAPAIMLVAAILAIASGCVTTQSDHKTPIHTWGGELTGDIVGSLTLQLRFKQVNKNTKSVTGKALFKMDRVSGGHGSGRMHGRLSGEIRDGILKATFSGEIIVTDGRSYANGSLKGPLTFSSGQGDWRIRTHWESRDYLGTWSIIRQ